MMKIEGLMTDIIVRGWHLVNASTYFVGHTTDTCFFSTSHCQLCYMNVATVAFCFCFCCIRELSCLILVYYVCLLRFCVLVRVFVLFNIIVFVRAILSWTRHFYIGYNIISLTSLQFILLPKSLMKHVFNTLTLFSYCCQKV